jgi:septum formation inhibitor MinC
VTSLISWPLAELLHPTNNTRHILSKRKFAVGGLAQYITVGSYILFFGSYALDFFNLTKWQQQQQQQQQQETQKMQQTQQQQQTQKMQPPMQTQQQLPPPPLPLPLPPTKKDDSDDETILQKGTATHKKQTVILEKPKSL